MALACQATLPAADVASLPQVDAWCQELLDREIQPCWLVDAEGLIVCANQVARQKLPLARAGAPLSCLDSEGLDGGPLRVALAQTQAARHLAISGGPVDANGLCLQLGRLADTAWGPLRLASLVHTTTRPAPTPRSPLRARRHGEVDAISQLSHEIRTPLNAVLGFAQLMQMNNTPSDPNDPGQIRQQGYLSHIVDAAKHILNLVDGLLNGPSSQSSPTTNPLHGADGTRLGSLFDACAALTASQFLKHGVQLNPIMPGRHLQAAADAVQCTQVLTNLLVNAAKYALPGGRVQVQAVATNGIVRISVIDDGPGLNAAQQARIFLARDRAGAESLAVQGHGLGLYISRQLVEGMGGLIGCISTEGQGCEFWFELPMAPPDTTALPAAR